MKNRKAIIGFSAITSIYLGVFIWLDYKNAIFSHLFALKQILPTLVMIAFASFCVRYLRWYWLLRKSFPKNGFLRGFLIYLSGFAFTASPGKIGELIRIRYHEPDGIPPRMVLSAFVFERSMDLLVLLLFGVSMAKDTKLFHVALAFVCLVFGILAFITRHPNVLRKLAAWLSIKSYLRLSRVLRTLQRGLSGIRYWSTPTDIIFSAILGIVAWSLIAIAFVHLVNTLGANLPFFQAFPVYPLSMLVGAASMIPGGVGSTEVAIIGLLGIHDVEFTVATLAAVGIRITTMWFAMFCGIISLFALENNR